MDFNAIKVISIKSWFFDSHVLFSFFLVLVGPLNVNDTKSTPTNLYNAKNLKCDFLIVSNWIDVEIIKWNRGRHMNLNMKPYFNETGIQPKERKDFIWFDLLSLQSDVNYDTRLLYSLMDWINVSTNVCPSTNNDKHLCICEICKTRLFLRHHHHYQYV